MILAYAATGIALFVFRRRSPDLAAPVPLLGLSRRAAALRRLHDRCSPRTPCASSRRRRWRASAILLLGLPVYFWHAAARVARRPREDRVAAPRSCWRSWPPRRAGLASASAPSLTGFTPRAKRLAAGVRADDCSPSRSPRNARPSCARSRGRRTSPGPTGNARVAEFLAAEYQKAGWEVETPAYDVLLSYPKSASARDRRRAADRAGPRRAADRRKTRTRRCRRRRFPGTPTPRRPKSRARSSTSTTAGPRTTNACGDGRGRRGERSSSRATSQRLSRREGPRGREARRPGHPGVLGSDRRRLVPGPRLPRRAVGTRRRTSSAAPTSTTSSSPAIR